MRSKWIVPGIICLVVGILAFFTSSEIEVQVGLLPFSFALITLLISGIVLVIAGLISHITDRL